MKYLTLITFDRYVESRRVVQIITDKSTKGYDTGSFRDLVLVSRCRTRCYKRASVGIDIHIHLDTYDIYK